MKRESREIWRKRILDWKASGKTAKEYAKDIGVNFHTLNHWSWQLGREGRDTRREATTTDQDDTNKGVSFVEVLNCFGDSTTGPYFELRLRCGRQILVPQQFDAKALKQLINVIEQAE